MNVEDIIKKNKEKRRNYTSGEKKEELPKNIKYLKGLISRILITIIFVLGSIIYTNINSDNKKLYKKYVLENSLSFTKINNLYNDLFGEIDFIKKNKDNSKPVFNNISYANIENYKNGVKLNVSPNETISVITSGIVVYIGEKEELGNTIIIQGNDGVDIWYSNLTDTNIKVYDYIESGTILGTSNSNEVYLTLLKDGKYMNYEEYIKSL
jgi:stage IV sporulation protein FA